MAGGVESVTVYILFGLAGRAQAYDLVEDDFKGHHVTTGLMLREELASARPCALIEDDGSVAVF
jgi:hypothetical protein